MDFLWLDFLVLVLTADLARVTVFEYFLLLAGRRLVEEDSGKRLTAAGTLKPRDRTQNNTSTRRTRRQETIQPPTLWSVNFNGCHHGFGNSPSPTGQTWRGTHRQQGASSTTTQRSEPASRAICYKKYTPLADDFPRKINRWGGASITNHY